MNRNHNPAHTMARRAVMLAVAISLGACATGNQLAPHQQLPSANETAARLHLSQNATTSASVPQDWWKAYQDEQLNHWVTVGLKDQPSLQQAQARAERTRAFFESRKANTAMQVSADADANREHISDNGFFPYPLAGATDTVFDAGLSASINLDVFGRLSSRIDAARLDAEAQTAVTDQVRIRLAGAIAQAYFALAYAQQTQKIVEDMAALREKDFDLIAQRVHAGFDTQLDRRTAELPLPEIKLELDRAQERVALARHALAILAGQSPDSADTTQASLPKIKPLASANSLTLDLLARRADITAARIRVQSALRTVDSAKAAFYPDISLTALVGLDSLKARTLLQASSRTWTVEPAIHLPLFDGGALRAELRDAVGQTDEAIADYNATVFQAVGEVADALSSLDSLHTQEKDQAHALHVAQAGLDLAQTKFDAGLGNRLAVISAQAKLLTQQRNQLDLAARDAALNVNLALALGGGYAKPAADQPATLTDNSSH